MMLQRTLLPFLFGSCLTASAAAQTLDQVIPEVGQPGDVLRIAGSDLGGVDSVAFTANVGGFVGQWTLEVNPIATAPNELFVEVPEFGNFVPPAAIPPGNYLGSLRLLDGGASTPPVPFGYLEATFGAVRTVGQGGTTPVIGPGTAPRISFDLGGGLPEWGNPDFQLDLWGAPLGHLAIVAIGTPGTPPFPQVFGGDVVLNLTQPVLTLISPLLVTGPYGRSTFKLPIKPEPPPPSSVNGLAVGLQWATVSILGGSPSASISNGLHVVL